jgi:hypothetical protein
MKKIYMMIRFYDNDASNFLGKEKLNVDCIYVDDKKKNDLLIHSNEKGKENDYLSIYKKTKSYLNLKNFNDLVKFYISSFKTKDKQILEPVTRGITSSQIKNLINWSSTKTNKQKYVFFDWDQTISVQNGLFYIQHDYMIQEYLSYLVGGKKRLLVLKNLFKTLHKNNCKVYILTNNDTSNKKISNKKFNYFIKLIHYLDPNFQKDNLLYGLDFNKTPQNSSKIRFINFIISKNKI